MNCIIVYSTFPFKEDAARTARILLEEQLAAGANIIQAESLFRWQGKIEQRAEWAVFFQAEHRFFKRIERRIKQLHPDTVPQIVMWRIRDGYTPFLQWILDETVRPVEKRERKEKNREYLKKKTELSKGKKTDGSK
ncbi:divalent-cation tolerance protein CutA [candidate division TA06 bacterium]|nr:divalent-cation tolerance protein CutA [candidate division TA06 bacterium]